MYPEIVWEFIMKYMGDSELNPAWRKKEEAEIPEGQGGIAVGTWQDMSDDFRLRFVAIMLKCYFVNDKYTRRAASTSRSMVPMPLPTTVCAIFRRASIRPFAQSGCSAHETWM